jgi:hypothetical protein
LALQLRITLKLVLLNVGVLLLQNLPANKRYKQKWTFRQSPPYCAIPEISYCNFVTFVIAGVFRCNWCCIPTLKRSNASCTKVRSLCTKDVKQLDNPINLLNCKCNYLPTYVDNEQKFLTYLCNSDCMSIIEANTSKLLEGRIPGFAFLL